MKVLVEKTVIPQKLNVTEHLVSICHIYYQVHQDVEVILNKIHVLLTARACKEREICSQHISRTFYHHSNLRG